MSDSFNQSSSTEAQSRPATFHIHASTGSYEVVVARGTFAEAHNQAQASQIIADTFFRTALSDISVPPIFIAATEVAKSLDRTPGIIEQLRKNGINRSTHLVAIGGGVIQDIAAFIASVYMRGLSWSYQPTTVLAMVDSCIGGKSSINVGPYKNLIGTFHPPKSVHIDPNHALSLPREQAASGLIEAAKICFCRGLQPDGQDQTGQDAFKSYLSHNPSPDIAPANLENVILESLYAKKWFIEKDEFDKKERLLLNFGHTFGHAIEGASSYGIPHGIAVGLGILCALNFQRQRGIAFASTPRVLMLEAHLKLMIHALADLPQQLKSLPLSEILERIGSDKKHTLTHYTLILVNQTGTVYLDRIPKSSTTDDQLKLAVQTMIHTLSS